METSRLRAIRALKQNMPVADRTAANQIQAGNDFLVQRAAGQAPLQGAALPQAQQIGAAVAAQTGQQQVAEANKQRTNMQQVGNLAMGAQQLQFQGQMGADQRATQSKLFEGQQRLGQIDEAAKKEIFDQRLQLANEDMSNKFLNERNLADFAIAQGKSEEQFRDYAQTAQQAYQKKQQLMQAAYNTLLQALEQEYQQGNLKLDQAQQERLSKFKVEVEKQMRRNQARASSFSQFMQAAGMIVGAVVGGAPGAAIGGGLGSLGAGAING